MNSELSILLRRCSEGDAAAEAAVFELSYLELKGIARGVLYNSRLPIGMQPTALIHEAFLKMPRAGEIDWNGRQHFFSIASRAMRRALVDAIREAQAAKRVSVEKSVSLDGLDLASILTSPEDALILDELLNEFESFDPLRAWVSEMRIFGGLSHEEIAHTIGKSTDAAKKDWKIAKLWLQSRLK